MRAAVATFVWWVALAAVSVQAAPISIRPTEISVGPAPLVEPVAQAADGVGIADTGKTGGVTGIGDIACRTGVDLTPPFARAKIGAGPGMYSRFARLFWVPIDCVA